MSTEKFTPTIIDPLAQQAADCYMPFITQNQHRDEIVKGLAKTMTNLMKEARKGHIKYRSMEAAAPDMYEALKDALDEIASLTSILHIRTQKTINLQGENNTMKVIRKIKAALSKANPQPITDNK